MIEWIVFTLFMGGALTMGVAAILYDEAVEKQRSAARTAAPSQPKGDSRAAPATSEGGDRPAATWGQWERAQQESERKK
ncbi:MAG TPA: hypothetical protein VNS34_10460 [Rhizobiaceae bacterium]|nr:hypothetical protein [Rhizobiaceae bacterium]